jgi:O-antigen/teichoic acid export membrane protein
LGIPHLNSPTARAMGPRLLLILDQSLFSGANFLLTTFLARHYAPAQFGAYGVGLSAALMIQFVQRNLYVVNLLLASERVVRRLLAGIIAKHLVVTGGVVGLVALALLVLAAAGIPAGTLDILAATLSCIVVYFQADFDRSLLVKHGAYRGAVLVSAAYLAIVLGLALAALKTRLGFDEFMIALAAGCLVKGAWIVALRKPPRWGWGLRLLARDWRDYGIPTLLAVLATAGYTYVPVMILAAVRGPAEVAGMMAMRSLTMPLNLVLRSLDAVDKNRFRAASGGTAVGVRRVFWRTMLGYAALGAGAVAILALFAHPIIAIVYRDRYAAFTGLLLCWCVYCALLGLMQPLQSVVLLARRQLAATRWSTLSGVAAAVIAFAACRGFGAAGAMSATLAAAALNVAISLYVVRDLVFGSHDRALPGGLGRELV